MTTAHRPTFDPARGKETLRGPAYHQRLLPAHLTLKHRQEGQGGKPAESRDLRAELLRAERAHYGKKHGTSDGADTTEEGTASASAAPKRALEDAADNDADESEEDPEAKRRRLILEEARAVDADSESDEDEDESSEEDDDDDDDDEAALQRELERIRAERAEQRVKEENERAAREEEQREFDIARGNPLLNPRPTPQQADFGVRRRWDDDVVFKNQARGTEDRKEKRFVNDLLRSDFHRRFMSRYVR